MTDNTLIRAQGKFVTLLAAILECAGIQPIGEFAAKLGVFAFTVSEDEPAEGEILAFWAAMVRDLASSRSSDPTSCQFTGRSGDF